MARQELQVRTTRPADAIAEIKHLLKLKRPMMLWGSPGIGKSDIIQQIGDEEDRPVIDLRLLLMEPTDLRGIPYYNKEKNCMDWAPSVGRSTGGAQSITFLSLL